MILRFTAAATPQDMMPHEAPHTLILCRAAIADIDDTLMMMRYTLLLRYERVTI